MNCELMHECLIDFVDGDLGEALAAECRAHLSLCAACSRDVAHHRTTAQLLGELPPLGAADEAISPARLRQMAALALAQAKSEPGEETAAGHAPPRPPVLSRATFLRRRFVRVATAAAVVLAAAFGTELLVRQSAGTKPDAEPPAFVSDPEFVGNFDVLSDMPLADSKDGELLDLDHDSMVMLQLLEDA